jgi:hypothetical protein
MLVFLTFGIFVFLHGFKTVSTSMLGYLTWFLKRDGEKCVFSAW